VVNLFSIPVQNLLPPLFPLSSKWNAAMDRFVASDFGRHFRGFESFAHLQRAPAEQNSGIGLGVCLLILVSLLALWRFRGRAGPARRLGLSVRLLHFAPW